MPAVTRRRLEVLFEPEVRRLEALLGREIASWHVAATADATGSPNGAATNGAATNGAATNGAASNGAATNGAATNGAATT